MNSSAFQATSTPTSATLFRVGLVAMLATTGWLLRDAFAPGAPRGSVLLVIQASLLVACGIAMLVAFRRDVRRSDSHRAEMNDEVYRQLAQLTGDMIFVSDLYGNSTFVAPSFAETLGLDAGALAGSGWQERVHPDDLATMQRMLLDLTNGHEQRSAEFRVRHADGSYRWFEARCRAVPFEGTDRLVRIVGSAHDIDERKARQDRLFELAARLGKMASTDTLTGLANRRRFDEIKTAEWARMARDLKPMSLLIVDVDEFKRFNDSYGHAEGDRALIAISEALTRAVRRPGDLCARYGGEEFVVLLPGTGDEGAFEFAEEICAKVRDLRITHAASPTGWLTVSVGVATAIAYKDDDGSLFDAADAALYRAKANGRNRCEGVHQRA